MVVVLFLSLLLIISLQRVLLLFCLQGSILLVLLLLSWWHYWFHDGRRLHLPLLVFNKLVLLLLLFELLELQVFLPVHSQLRIHVFNAPVVLEELLLRFERQMRRKLFNRRWLLDVAVDVINRGFRHVADSLMAHLHF